MARLDCDPRCDVRWIDGRVECITWDVGNCGTPLFPDHCPVLSRYVSWNGCWFYECPDPPEPTPVPPTPAPTPAPRPGPDQWNEAFPAEAIGAIVVLAAIALIIFCLCKYFHCCICSGRRGCRRSGDRRRLDEEGGEELEGSEQGEGDYHRNLVPQNSVANPAFDPTRRLVFSC